MSGTEPIRLLIAAMGGEGGGVLAGWIVEAAHAAGLWAQRTSIPGVAQRTGATTYYIEVMPKVGSRRPVLALNPSPGQVDIVLSTELLETARTIRAGLVTPDRTLLIASSHRIYTVAEKSAMGDGRLDSGKLTALAKRAAKQVIMFDLAKVANESSSHLNAVLLGALAASGTLPIEAEVFQEAIRSGGKAVTGNLRGFEAGLSAAASDQRPNPGSPARTKPLVVEAKLHDLETKVRRMFDEESCGIVVQGLHRLIDYQDVGYAKFYLERLAPFAVGTAAKDVLPELARHLAVRMSFEDTIRVAQLKLRDSRIRRVEAEAKAQVGDVVHITEFFKPGPEEILSILPAALARRLLRICENRGWSGKSFPMKIRTTSLSGLLKLKFLTAFRPLRPRSLRYAEEQAWIETWLDLVRSILEIDPAAAREVIETARLVKGYGDTYRRGHANWRKIVERIVHPMLAHELPLKDFADAVMQARMAALADPDGRRLDDVIDSLWARSQFMPRSAAE